MKILPLLLTLLVFTGCATTAEYASHAEMMRATGQAHLLKDSADPPSPPVNPPALTPMHATPPHRTMTGEVSIGMSRDQVSLYYGNPSSCAYLVSGGDSFETCSYRWRLPEPWLVHLLTLGLTYHPYRTHYEYRTVSFVNDTVVGLGW